MTDEELSLKIAEFFGYKQIQIEIAGKVYNGWQEPEGSGFDVNAPDFVADPAMTVMLMEKLLNESGLAFSKWISGPPNVVCIRGNWNDGAFISLPREIGGYQADLKLGRAVAEVFARAKGLI